MSVLVVTDSSACLPPALATEYGITVLDFHAEGEGEDETTAGLGALELTACYARLLERGGDDGVVALHISKELSGTWSSASQAAAVLDGRVEVIDTMSGGMVIGQAAIAAARCADDGGSLEECRGVAQHAIDTGQLWLFVNRLDTLARGGRLTAGQRLLSTALAIKPIMHLAGGRLELAAKTRTRSKAMERMVTLAANAYRDVAEALLPAEELDEPDELVAASESDDVESKAQDSAATVAASESDEVTSPVDTDGADDVEDSSGAGEDLAVSDDESVEPAEDAETADSDEATEVAEAAEPAGVAESSEVPDSAAPSDRPRIFNFGGRDRADKTEKSDKTDKAEKTDKSDKAESERSRSRRRSEEQVVLVDLPRVPMHLAVHHREAEEAAEQLRANLREKLPDCVVISVVDISHAMAVHTGPGALAVSLVQD
ncbi:DegV family protein [Corynebacterium sp. AOP40-9SA-29]|uniref:DegV family protein n=1 Tax=Corynebacterium sp. AOP40-9SA-29 TaxID=3457677 RepID=UPI00403475F3